MEEAALSEVEHQRGAERPIQRYPMLDEVHKLLVPLGFSGGHKDAAAPSTLVWDSGVGLMLRPCRCPKAMRVIPLCNCHQL